MHYSGKHPPSFAFTKPHCEVNPASCLFQSLACTRTLTTNLSAHFSYRSIAHRAYVFLHSVICQRKHQHLSRNPVFLTCTINLLSILCHNISQIISINISQTLSTTCLSPSNSRLSVTGIFIYHVTSSVAHTHCSMPGRERKRVESVCVSVYIVYS